MTATIKANTSNGWMKCGGGDELILGAARAQTAGREDAFERGEQHLHLLAIPARDLASLHFGDIACHVSGALVD